MPLGFKSYTHPFRRLFFFPRGPAHTQIYTLSLHDALPISACWRIPSCSDRTVTPTGACRSATTRSEEHTSELQSPYDLVCRLLLEKKNFPFFLPVFVSRASFVSAGLSHLSHSQSCY